VSRENVDFVRNLVVASASMDQPTLIAALPDLIPQIADPAIEWVEDPTRVDSRIWRGHDGVITSFTQWLEQWDEYSWQAERFVDCGDDVFIAARERGSGATSGATVSSSIFIVVTVRDQKILRWREFYDESQALKAVGLEE
jgi:ketosteroid isomerase-like protein